MKERVKTKKKELVVTEKNLIQAVKKDPAACTSYETCEAKVVAARQELQQAQDELAAALKEKGITGTVDLLQVEESTAKDLGEVLKDL